MWHGASEMWHGASEMWHGASEMWHGTSEMWHGASEMWHGTARARCGTERARCGTARARCGTARASEMWHGASEMWHGASEMWHGTSEMWHVGCCCTCSRVDVPAGRGSATLHDTGCGIATQVAQGIATAVVLDHRRQQRRESCSIVVYGSSHDAAPAVVLRRHSRGPTAPPRCRVSLAPEVAILSLPLLLSCSLEDTS